MKLLSWMHRKPRKDPTSSFKPSDTGSTCDGLFLKSSLDGEEDHITSSFGADCHHFKDFNAGSYEGLNTREDDEIFPGFLTIGTLSVGLVTEPSTPTFGFDFWEANKEGITDIKYDLKLISENLEKLLKAEKDVEKKNELLPKKSDASDITLGDEFNKEEISNSTVEKQLHPLEEFLLRSSTQQCSPKETEEKGKISLHGLFKRNRYVKKNSSSEDEKSGKRPAKGNKLSKYLKNKMQQTPPSCPTILSASTGCTTKPLRKGTKLNKIRSLFHKKIHPEISNPAEEDTNFSKYENGRNINKPRSASRKSGMIGCWSSITNGKYHPSKTDLNLPPDAITKINLDTPRKDMVRCAERGQWITTDAEYFVLEL